MFPCLCTLPRAILRRCSGCGPFLLQRPDSSTARNSARPGCTKRRPPRQRLLPSKLRGKDDRLELAELRLIDSRLKDVALNVCNGDE